MDNLLSKINSPRDLKEIPKEKLPEVAREIRKLIIDTVSKTGGHLASNLGVVELTIALYYVLDIPEDKVIWDVGHQCYSHKILTGRRDRFHTLRQFGGISGFPNKNESEYDLITSGHSSTSVSFALGLAAARDIKKGKEKVVAVIGDGALSGGEAFEGLNNAGQLAKDLIIILNTNEMSISVSVGALSKYLNRIITNPLYNKVRDELKVFLGRIPKLGSRVSEAGRRFEEGLKNLIVPGAFFEELGLRYFGPIDGHNIEQLISTFESVVSIKGPKIIHVLTKKGKGYKPAEKNPAIFHSSKPFSVKNGRAADVPADNKETEEQTTYTKVFSNALTELSRENKRIVAVSAAMADGTGLDKFALEFPERFFDVGIAEQHALTFCAGLAVKGFIPVAAIYSTFLQRGYDQIFHDICLQDSRIILCLDRAGLVGDDGPTHHGIFDISYLRHLPNLVIMAPKDANELISMLATAVNIKHPVAIRYPKDKVDAPQVKEHPILPLGRSDVLRKGEDVCLLAYGSMVKEAVEAAVILEKAGIGAEVINARFVKPLDEKMIENIAKCGRKVITIEEGSMLGGFGSAVAEMLQANKEDNVHLRILGLPDKFIEHGNRRMLLDKYGLGAEKIAEFVKKEFFK
ncbi:MAG: 1-deoxy-D-xylulose-5-phosphate synthase [Candidatus Omnitrophica bacterium]|nr:1-deoxy-D-xylulose-5-phosphate synthase [Candidatus Omnitrophota bacterium]